MESWRYYLLCKQLPRIGNTTIISSLEETGSIEETFNQLSQKAINFQISKVRKRVDDLLAMSESLKCRIITLDDDEYPNQLRLLSDAPPYFFIQGRLTPMDFNCVAIVGTRNMTSYGKSITQDITRYLAQKSVTIVSGFMRGIDTVAHVTAIKASTRTIAVLGSGMQFPVPPENKKLIPEIIENGAVISEFDIDQPPTAYTFPIRNRIVAAFAKATIVIEAGEKSGALITARHTAEQGKDVYSVPGNIYSRASAGANWLLANGAIPVLSVEQLISDLGLGNSATVSVHQFDNDLQKQLYSRITRAPIHVDDLVREIAQPTAVVLQELSILEIHGKVKKVENDTYVGC